MLSCEASALPNLSKVLQGPKQDHARQEPSSKLWLLSMTADQAALKADGHAGHASPPGSASATSPVVKSTEMSMDEWKKARRREQCRINQANYRKRQRMYASAGKLRISSTLNADQAAALKMAIEACGYAQSKRRKVKQDTVAPKDTIDMTTEEMRKERRREQCRINQANYRKRQRENRPKLARQIEALEEDIERLEAFRTAQQQRKQAVPIQAISEFYYVLGLPVEQQQFSLVELQQYERTYGYSPALQVLLDLQREEFDSVESLALHWRWYRTQFHAFEYSMKSYERLNAGEHVIVKVVGELRMDVHADVKTEDNASGYDMIVCPVVQQFEFEEGGAVTRITSEVDFVGGVVAVPGQKGPESALSALQRLSEAFYTSNRSGSNF